MKTVKYQKQVFQQVVAPNQESCEGCYFLTYPGESGPWDRPCGKDPVDPKFPACVAVGRKTKKNMIFVLKEG